MTQPRESDSEPCPFCGYTGPFDGHVCEEHTDGPITPYEARCVRLGLVFGDPAGVGQADPDLDRAKAKLLAIEKQGSW